MSEQKKYVVIFFINPEKKQIYLLKKHKPNKPEVAHLHNRLNGFGGEIDPEDNGDIFKATKREVKEELGIELKQSFTIINQGYFISFEGSKVYVMKSFADDSWLKPQEIPNEGVANWYPLDYFRNHSNEFPKGYTPVYEKAFLTDESFEIDLRKL